MKVTSSYPSDEVLEQSHKELRVLLAAELGCVTLEVPVADVACVKIPHKCIQRFWENMDFHRHCPQLIQVPFHLLQDHIRFGSLHAFHEEILINAGVWGNGNSRFGVKSKDC